MTAADDAEALLNSTPSDGSPVALSGSCDRDHNSIGTYAATGIRDRDGTQRDP